MTRSKKREKKFDQLSCFSENAKSSLEKYVNEYRESLIAQTLLIEEMSREGSVNQNPEVTATHVARAEQTLKIKNNRKKNKMSIFIYIVSEMLMFISGIIMDWEKIKTSFGYFIFVLIIALLTVIFVCIKYIKGVD